MKKILLVFLILCIAFTIWIISCGAYEAILGNNFEGNIKIYASGELVREYDCYGDLVGFKIGSIDILKETITWEYGLQRIPIKGSVEGEWLSWDKLISGNDYTLYRKSYGQFWVRSIISNPIFNAHPTSYFIECK